MCWEKAFLRWVPLCTEYVEGYGKNDDDAYESPTSQSATAKIIVIAVSRTQNAHAPGATLAVRMGTLVPAMSRWLRIGRMPCLRGDSKYDECAGPTHTCSTR